MKEFDNTYSNLRKGWLLRTVVFLCLLILAYWAMMSVTPVFPAFKLSEHLKDASLLLENEKIFGMPFGNMPTMDNYSDALMLNITGSLNSREPIRSAMIMNVSNTPDSSNTPVQDLRNLAEGRVMETWSYARYWHGAVVFMRPMLSFMSFGEIRKLIFFCMMILFSITMILLARKTDSVVTLGFGISMTFGGFPLLSFCMTFAGVFIIAFTAMCVILRSNTRDEESLVRLFLLTGSLTTFIGFGGLSAPIVTFMFPLLSLILPDLKMRSFHWDWRYVRRLFLFGIAWSAGYSLTWGAKWLLADAILGEGLILHDAMNSILFHSGSGSSMKFFERLLAIVKNIYAIWPFSMWSGGGDEKAHAIYAIFRHMPEMEGSWFTKLGLMIKEVSVLLPSSILLGLSATVLFLVVYLAVIIFLVIDGKKRRPFGVPGYFCLAFLFLVPYFWFFVTAKHAEVHYWFTYRNQISSLWLFLILPHIMKNREDN